MCLPASSVFPAVYHLKIPLFDKGFRDPGFVFALISGCGCHTQIGSGLPDRAPGFHAIQPHFFFFFLEAPVFNLKLLLKHRDNPEHSVRVCYSQNIRQLQATAS